MTPDINPGLHVHMLTYTHKEEKEEEGMKRKRHRACKYEALNLDPTTHIKLDTVACICVQSQTPTAEMCQTVLLPAHADALRWGGAEERKWLPYRGQQPIATTAPWMAEPTPARLAAESILRF